MDNEAVLDTVNRLAQALSPGDLDQTLRNITTSAVEVLPEVGQASITVLHEDGTLATAAETADVLLELDARQYDLREGPCYEAATARSHVVSPDLASDERFRQYASVPVRRASPPRPASGCSTPATAAGRGTCTPPGSARSRTSAC